MAAGNGGPRAHIHTPPFHLWIHCRARVAVARRLLPLRKGQASQARQERHRPRRRGDDGEPLVRPPARLAARRRRPAGGPDVTPTATAPRTTTHRLTDFQGCDHPDPDHSLRRWPRRVQRRRVRRVAARRRHDDFAIGYYQQADLAVLRPRGAGRGRCATATSRPSWRPTYPEPHLPARRPDRPPRQHDSRSRTLPTIWDRLADAGRRRPLLLQRRPVHRRSGARSTLAITPHVSTHFLSDCAAGHAARRLVRRPAVPRRARRAPRRDDHPHGDIRAGEPFLNQIYTAVTHRPDLGAAPFSSSTSTSGAASSTTSPPEARPTSHPAWPLRGFRVPCLVDLAPGPPRLRRARHLRPHVGAQDDRVAVRPAAAFARDAAANNLAEVLDFKAHGSAAPPVYDVAPILPAPCPTA